MGTLMRLQSTLLREVYGVDLRLIVADYASTNEYKNKQWTFNTEN